MCIAAAVTCLKHQAENRQMNLTLSEKLAAGSSAVIGALSAIGVAAFVEAYEHIAPSIELDNWSAFFIPFLSNVALLVVSAIGFFGVLFGRAQRTRAYAFVFVVGVILITIGRWAAVALGILRFPGTLGVLSALVGIAWFAGLAFALRPKYSPEADV